jgi:2-keto-4-pentenoate hydratase/2-oxohepta-3-ene-1,7-dioic acid hydratase in catechol pathway
MKIVRFLDSLGVVRYGSLTDKKQIRVIKGDIFGQFEVTDKTVELTGQVRILAPVDPPLVIAAGLNYKSHADEGGLPYPDKPILFIKASGSVVGPDDNIVLPHMAPHEVDYEAELAVIVSKQAKNIPADRAREFILGYTCGNDLSARDCQMRIDRQWARAKSFDTFCPLGPCITTDVDPTNLDIRLTLNGKTMQHSNTGDLICPVDELFSFISYNMTLKPGTVIMTGTPSGVGCMRKPPVYLKPGDVVEVTIEGIGTLRNEVVLELPPEA